MECTVDLMPALPEGLAEEERDVLTLMHREGYAAVEDRYGWSRGRTYALAVRLGMRKTEARIRERKAERLLRQKEYLELVIGQTAKADVLDYLAGLPDESVQMFITSVPYNLGKSYGEGPGADQMAALRYHGWLMMIISEMSRILKPGGVVFLQSGKTRDWQEQLMPIDVLVFEDFRKAGLTFQTRIIWTVPHGLTPADRPADRYETALVFSKGPVRCFNASAARTPQKNPGKRAYKGPRKGELSGHPFGAWPSDVWGDIPSTRHNHPERRHSNHPAQFPVGLVRRAILLWTLPGDLVSDPFNGSGTSQIGAIQTGRAFTGADLFYEDIRENRLAAEGHLDVASLLPGITDESARLWQDNWGRDAVWNARAREVSVPARELTPDEEAQIHLDVFGEP